MSTSFLAELEVTSLTSIQQKRFVWVIQMSYVCYLSGAISKITNVILSLSINVKMKLWCLRVCVCVFLWLQSVKIICVKWASHILFSYISSYIVCQIWNKMHFIYAVEHMPRVASIKCEVQTCLLFIECNVSCHIQ